VTLSTHRSPWNTVSGLHFTADNSGFSGEVFVENLGGVEGYTIADGGTSLGTGTINVQTDATLALSGSFDNRINVAAGARVGLHADATVSDLHLANTGPDSLIYLRTDNNHKLSGTVNVNGNCTLLNYQGPWGDKTLTIDAALIGAGNMTKSGSKPVKIDADNSATFSGDWMVAEGTLQVTHTGGLGSGGLEVASGAIAHLDVDAAGWAIHGDVAGAGLIKVGAGARTVTVQGGTVTPGYVNADLSHNQPLHVEGGMAFAGSAALAVDVLGVYTGTNVVPDDIHNRKLLIDEAASGLANATLHVAVNSGTLTLPEIQGTKFTVLQCGNDIVTEGEAFGDATFDDYAGFSLGGPIEYGYDSVSGTGTVTVQVTIKADADCNLLVDVLDLAAIANNFDPAGAGKGWRQGDFDYDGDVDVLDLAILANNFNKDARGAGGEGGAPVPEPASAALVLLGAVAVLRRRKR